MNALSVFISFTSFKQTQKKKLNYLLLTLTHSLIHHNIITNLIFSYDVMIHKPTESNRELIKLIDCFSQNKKKL